MLFVNLNVGINHYQAPLADALYNILGKDFVFIEYGFKKGGQYGSFKDMNQGVDFYKGRPYILKMYESKENEQLAKELIMKADTMRVGGEPLSLTAERIKADKLTFRSSERIFKGPLWKDIVRYRNFYKVYHHYSNPNYRVLCQSAFLPNDLRFFGKEYGERCYKFAYFADIPKLDIKQVVAGRQATPIQIIWCARFIDWKHPELPLQLAEKLIESGRNNFNIQMIGADTTPLWKKIKEQVIAKRLDQHIILTGGIPNTEVLQRMRDSHIFIFTSDRGEGWGVVLNEAMGAGCACVASNEIGAVPYLLSNGKNGLIFKSCSAESFFEKVSYLYDNRRVAEQMGKNAYETVTTTWSAKKAATRLVELSESIIIGKEKEFDDGPCSKAYPCNSDNLFY